MLHAARASVNRATARFILRSGSAASKGSSTAPPSPRHFLIPRIGIKITRNSPENNALHFSNRPKSARSGAPSASHNSPLATQKISHPQLVSVLPAISNRHKLQLESSVTSRKQTTAPNSNRHKFSPNSAPALRGPAVTTHQSPITPFLFDTNERARKTSNLFKTNKKTFLLGTFKRFSGLLFDTFERPSMYPFLPVTRHGRIAAL
jgi:hypothetical protein